VDQTLGNRKQPRFAVNNLTVSINGKAYRIFNISENGVGFLIDSPDEIEIGREIKPITVNGSPPVRIAGIPRHISQFQPPGNRLHFKAGWVCGTEFTTQNDPDGGKLLEAYIAEQIKNANEENNR
jgi:hypothetical protein